MEGEELSIGMHLGIYEFFLLFFSYGERGREKEREREGDLEIMVTVPKGEAREGEGRWVNLERLGAHEGKRSEEDEKTVAPQLEMRLFRGACICTSTTQVQEKCMGQPKVIEGREKSSLALFWWFYISKPDSYCGGKAKIFFLKGASPFS